jgi:anti-sigma regulatory factor (Ser/Thr protein kinase)
VPTVPRAGKVWVTALPIDLTLPPDTQSPWRARCFVAETLGADTPRVADVALIVSEMVTNAVLHARTDVRVSIKRGPTTIRVEVADDSESGPTLQHFTQQAATGRGLHLVEQLADRWGSEPRTGGKVVWFEVVAASQT